MTQERAPAPFAGAQPRNTAGWGSPGSAATVTSRATATPPARPAPSSVRVQPAVSSSRGSSYLELWVGVMPRPNDAKGGNLLTPRPRSLFRQPSAG